MLNFKNKNFRIIQKPVIFMCILCLNTPLLAEDKKNNFLQMAKRAYGAINADLVELNRIADYQNEIIKLAQEDPASASNFIRSTVGCAQRKSVLKLCKHLTQSYYDKEVLR